MNEILQGLLERTSLRHFSPRPISPEDRLAILSAAAAAPTAGNQQLYTILDITDPALKERLSSTCDHQPFIARAAMVLIFLADFQRWYDAFQEAGCSPRRPGPGDLLLAVDDALIAAQNAVTAAHSLGIDSCYIGDIMEQCRVHRELFCLPEYVFPAAMVVFGYPAPGAGARAKPERLPLEGIVRENTYRRMDGEQLRRLFAGKTGGEGFDAWMTAFCRRKYNSSFSREMTRSVNEYLASFDGDGT